MDIGLESVVSYLPEGRVTAEDYAHLRPFMPEWMAMPAEKRRFADPLANEIMVVKVAEKALASAGLAPRDIDLIVCQSFGGRFIVPGLAGFLHKKLGFRRAAPAWNIQDICASFLDGCEVASNAIRSGSGYRRVLVLAVSALETGGWGIDTSHPTAAILGDGATAAVVSAENLRGVFLAYNSETYGEIYSAAALGFEQQIRPELLRGSRWVLNRACGPRLDQEFDDIYANLFGQMAVDAIRNASEKAGLRPGDIDLVVAHQAFSGLVEIWQKAVAPLGLPAERWRTTWDKYGNVGACDVGVTLADLIEERAIPRGARLALFAPGGGGHTPTIILRWNG